ncbi:MAG: response regulator [Elusimicrobia bacterium]|nr:response regulator [Candidatus Liberimonas magnetica]
MKILVADDDITVLEYLKFVLEGLGHEVTVTDNSNDVLRLFVLNEPDLIMLDIVLPGKDGLMLLKEIKEIDAKTAVVMITAYKDAEKAMEAFHLGAIDCLLKPFNVDYLRDAVLSKVCIRRK